MPSSAIHVLWLCLRPCGVRPSLTGSQQASGMSSGDRPDASSARRGVGRGAWPGGWPGGDRDAGPRGGVSDGDPGGLAGLCLVPAVARRAEHAAGVVAAPGVAAVRAGEHVVPAAAVLRGAGAPVPGLAFELAGEQPGQERREVHGQAWFPVRAAVGVVLRREPVERAPDLAQLPFDVDLIGVDEARVPGRSPRPTAGRCKQS